MRLDCKYDGGKKTRLKRKELSIQTTPTVDQAVDFFTAYTAYTAELYPDVHDRVAHKIIDIRSGEGSTVRFYNAAEEEFMKLGVCVMPGTATRPYSESEANFLL